MEPIDQIVDAVKRAISEAMPAKQPPLPPACDGCRELHAIMEKLMDATVTAIKSFDKRLATAEESVEDLYLDVGRCERKVAEAVAEPIKRVQELDEKCNDERLERIQEDDKLRLRILSREDVARYVHDLLRQELDLFERSMVDECLQKLTRKGQKPYGRESVGKTRVPDARLPAGRKGPDRGDRAKAHERRAAGQAGHPGRKPKPRPA